MSLPTDERERLKLFIEALKAGEKRKATRRAELGELVRTVPIPDELVEEIAWLGPEGEREVMRNHPGYELHEKLKALNVTRAVFKQTHSDLLKVLGEFDSFSQSAEMGRRSGRTVLERIHIAVSKELMAFSTAAGVLVYHGRRLKEPLEHLHVEETRKLLVEDQRHRFVIGLRNAIAHGDVIDVSYQIAWARDRERTTDFILYADRLLAAGTFNAEAQAFIRSCGEEVHVREMADAYAAAVDRFYAWLDKTLDENVAPALVDYRRCRRTCQANGTRTWYRIVFQQVLARNVDPFQHLDKYLTPEQIEEGMKLPLRSRAQVDYFIAAADEDGACDDELRQMIYEIFGVADG